MATEISIDLRKTIESLESRFIEIGQLLENCPGPNPADIIQQRRQIRNLMADLHEQIDALETIEDNSNAANVTVKEPSPSEVTEFNAALAKLNTVIQRQEVWANTISNITDLLNAARSVASLAGR